MPNISVKQPSGKLKFPVSREKIDHDIIRTPRFHYWGRGILPGDERLAFEPKKALVFQQLPRDH